MRGKRGHLEYFVVLRGRGRSKKGEYSDEKHIYVQQTLFFSRSNTPPTLNKLAGGE
jgi:hypothetical protein